MVQGKNFGAISSIFLLLPACSGHWDQFRFLGRIGDDEAYIYDKEPSVRHAKHGMMLARPYINLEAILRFLWNILAV